MDFTNRVLYHKAKLFDFRNPERNRRLAQAMLWIMQGSQGIGLAAPQVGISRRMFVMNIDGVIRSCFNPEIIQIGSEFSTMAEGCLSFPGDSCTITRPREVRVQYQNADGDLVQADLEELEARCFQHELDHLDGITMWDRIKEQNAKQS